MIKNNKKNIVYTFFDNTQDGEKFVYDVNEWGGDKEAIYADVLESFGNEEWVWKQKERDGTLVYLNHFHIKQRQEGWWKNEWDKKQSLSHSSI